MKYLLFIVFFISFGLHVSSQPDPNKTNREYLPEIQVDSIFQNMLDNVLTTEAQESYYRKDFNYGITFFSDQHGNDCIQIEAIGRRVLKNGIEFGVMTYKGHIFIFYGKKNNKVNITEKKVPFDFAVNQTQVLKGGTLLLDGIENDSFSTWIFRYDDDELKLIVYK